MKLQPALSETVDDIPIIAPPRLSLVPKTFNSDMDNLRDLRGIKDELLPGVSNRELSDQIWRVLDRIGERIEANIN